MLRPRTEFRMFYREPLPFLARREELLRSFAGLMTVSREFQVAIWGKFNSCKHVVRAFPQLVRLSVLLHAQSATSIQSTCLEHTNPLCGNHLGSGSYKALMTLPLENRACI